jgi:hypothetical protein
MLPRIEKHQVLSRHGATSDPERHERVRDWNIVMSQHPHAGWAAWMQCNFDLSA